MFKKINIFVLCLALAGAISSPGNVLAGNITDYSILAQESIHLDKKATVLSGFVGVNDPSAEPSFKQDVHLLVDRKVLLEEGTRLTAPSIYIKRDSVIKGDIYYKDRFFTQDDVTTTGDIVILNAPNDWPLINMPAPPACAPDTTNPLAVAKNSQMTMPPGRYGDVRLNRKSTLILPGGEYHLNSFYVDEDARVLFSGPATLCVANTFQTRSDVFWGPQNDLTTISGADIQVFVNGTDTYENPGRHSREDFKKHPKRDAAAQIGKKNVFFGQVMALNGTLEIEKAAQVNGAYIARDIIVGQNSVVTKDTSETPVDTTPPLITSINPAEGSVVDTATPVISADFQDTESGVDPASIQISVDGQDVTSQANASETGFNFISGFLSDGAHVLSISVSDNSGNNAQTAVNFTINTDMSPPQILNVSPADGSLHSDTPAQISADFYDDKAIDANSAQILLDNVDITAQSNVTAAGFEFLVTTALSDGVHTLFISVRDAVGNPTQTSTNFTIDTSVPDIAILIPADGSLLATATPTISGNLSDATSGIDMNSVRIAVDGVDLTSQAVITQTTFETSVLIVLDDGNHTITVEAADMAGNSAIQTSGFTIDTIAPVISNLTPANMSTIMANVPTISAAFADSGSGIDVASAQILVDNVNVTPQATVTETGFSYTPTVPLNNGYHAVAVTIADVADNMAQAAYSFNVLLDLVPPTIFNITPAAGNLLATSTPTLSANFSDNLTGVAPSSAQILLDGVEVTAQANVTANGFSFVPAALSDGAHELSISIRDNQGNPAQASVNFTTDTTAPTISNLTPADGSIITINTPAISADFTDGLSGVNTSNVQILLDNNDVTLQAVIMAAGFDLTPASPLANGGHTVEVQVADIAGNIAQTSFGFTVAIPTPVSGAITQNTLWTLADSPYIVMGNITVNSGVTLTVEPGVIVKFNGFYAIEMNGIINAQGTAGNPITFTSAQTAPARGNWNALTLHGSGNILNYVTVEYADKGVYVPSSPLGQTPAIRNSTIQNNTTGIYFEPSTGPIIQTNTISNNNDGIFAGCNVYTGCTPTISGNSIYNNSHYNLYVYSYGTNASARTINAQNNWWGSTNALTIEATIFHRPDSGILPLVNYDHFLDGPGGNPTGFPPAAPVLNSAVPGNQQITLQWTAAATATGYKVKYGTASGIYGTTLDVGNVTTYPVTGLTNDTPYYFVVTAYNGFGERDPSNQLNQTPTNAAFPPPVISQNTTWTLANSPYRIVNDVTVNAGVTLTIEAGVEVRFTGFFKIEGNGIINAQGTAGNPVSFVSEKSFPAKGDWNYISLRNGSSVLNYVRIEHADRGVYVPYPSVSPLIQNSLIQNNNRGIYFELTTDPRVLANTITNNTDGIYAFCNVYTGCRATINDNGIYGNSSHNLYEQSDGDSSYEWLNARNNWWGSADPAVIMASIYDFLDDNTRAAVDFTPFLDGPGGAPDHSFDTRIYGNIQGSLTLTSASSPYYLLGNLIVGTGETLTVEPGVTVKAEGNHLITINGKLAAQGTAGNLIEFTSNQPVPVAGDWKGIFMADASDDTSGISYARVKYANRGVELRHANTTVTHDQFLNNIAGLYIFGTNTSVITDNVFDNNSQYGVMAVSAIAQGVPGPAFTRNALLNNGQYDVFTGFEGVNHNVSSAIMNFEDNWWGTDDPAQIAAQIWDYQDHNWRPKVDFAPYLITDPENAIAITNNSVTLRFFNPARNEAATINYTLGTGANVTIKIYQPPSTLMRTLINVQAKLAGANSDSWDGRDDLNQILPAGPYVYTIDAQSISGQSGRYDPISFDGSEPLVSNATITPSASFSPLKGERLRVQYDLPAASRISLRFNTAVETVVEKPRNTTGNVDYWNGRDMSGNIVVSQSPVVIEAKAERLPENVIVIHNATPLDVTTLTSDPCVIRPLFNETTRITYAINDVANVTVNILKQDGSQVVKFLENTILKTAGTYTLNWDGKTSAGETVVEPGDYRVRVEAIDGFGVTTVRDGNITILR
ncbi:MAG: right-handed parallel beta-helix repeat-containing protein [Candidatus Omnitrophica bacterium]|nr:right-handed parallel beta-helix repeat-containing protein [Candidatus Omnitrophota bacterium]